MGQALSYALRMLKRRPYSVWEIKQALSKRSLEPAEIEPIIQELVEHKLLDDRQYALSFVHTKDRLHPEGEFKLRQDLARKGVDEETVVWALKEAHLTEEEAESEDERALKLLNQYWRRWEREEPKSRKRKQSSLLARRGFAPSVIWRILKEWEK